MASYLKQISKRGRGERGEQINQKRLGEAVARLMRVIDDIDDNTEECTLAEIRRRYQNGDTLDIAEVSTLLMCIHDDLTSVHYVLTHATDKG